MKTATMTEPIKFTLKPISKDGVASAIDKAEQYRLLNQPQLAESICLDVLDVDSQNQKAMIILLLSLTDQFGKSASTARRKAEELAKGLKDNYAKLYYTGIVRERMGSAALHSGLPGSDFDAYEWYLEAMEFYEQADNANQDSKNEDPTLRWNTCARLIMQYDLKARPQGDESGMLE
ncbi:MAG TPA: hypothetical protein VFE50_18375 [Cyclobacteriaceae bacterium]|nr:hypothetical protein [Cyclobacteriaceae bacterium]